MATKTCDENFTRQNLLLLTDSTDFPNFKESQAINFRFQIIYILKSHSFKNNSQLTSLCESE